MASPKVWSNVAVALESAKAAADTISGITKANPGVVTCSAAHGLSNGDYVVVDIEGMYQLDGKVVRVANVGGSSPPDTFELEGIDTTAYGTFSSGTAEEVTFGTTVGTITTLSASGGDFEFIDTTTIHDAVAKQIPGVASAAVYTSDNIWDVADTGLVAMKAASDTKAQKCFKFTFSDGQIMAFCGYVGASLLPTGSAQDLVTTPTTFTAYGTPTYYSS